MTTEFQIEKIKNVNNTSYATFYAELIPLLPQLTKAEIIDLILILYLHDNKNKNQLYTVHMLSNASGNKYDTLLSGLERLEEKKIITIDNGKLKYNKEDIEKNNVTKIKEFWSKINQTKKGIMKQIKQLNNELKEALKNKDYNKASEITIKIDALTAEIEKKEDKSTTNTNTTQTEQITAPKQQKTSVELEKQFEQNKPVQQDQKPQPKKNSVRDVKLFKILTKDINNPKNLEYIEEQVIKYMLLNKQGKKDEMNKQFNDLKKVVNDMIKEERGEPVEQEPEQEYKPVNIIGDIPKIDYQPEPEPIKLTEEEKKERRSILQKKLISCKQLETVKEGDELKELKNEMLDITQELETLN